MTAGSDSARTDFLQDRGWSCQEQDEGVSGHGTSWYHCQASGLMGSPTVPKMRRLAREYLAGQSSPKDCSARMAVGAVYRMLTCARMPAHAQLYPVHLHRATSIHSHMPRANFLTLSTSPATEKHAHVL
jgi:hypothetical protein